MTITEKLAMEHGHEIHLHKEGVFWVAYEHSAYWVHLRSTTRGCNPLSEKKGYKPTKKFIKAAQQDVVTVGFPNNALSSIVETLHATSLQNHIIVPLSEPIDHAEFMAWKNNIPCRGQISSTQSAHPSHLSLLSQPEQVKIGIGQDEIETGQPQGIAPTPLMNIVEQIEQFDIANATPMMCMNFVAELKQHVGAYAIRPQSAPPTRGHAPLSIT
jgi:hypothetical protein